MKIIVSEEEFSYAAGKFVEWNHYETEAEELPKNYRVEYGKGCKRLLRKTAWCRWVYPYGNGKRLVFRTPEVFAEGRFRYTYDQLQADLLKAETTP